MKYFSCTLVGLLTILSGVLAVDYCSKDICPNGDHVACGNNGTFGANCPSPYRSVVPLTSEVISLLLYKHNTARMNVANGNVPGFSIAKKMIEVVWDNELAMFAEMTAKTCTFAHDKCRNTATFKNAGQNIGLTMTSYTNPLDNRILNYKEMNASINQVFDLWFNEYVNCNMSQIDNLTGIYNENGESYGHFTQIVMASSQRIGCAIGKYYDTWKNLFIVCNYSQTNMINSPVYVTGTPCSGCNSRCSAPYPGLCEGSEVIW